MGQGLGRAALLLSRLPQPTLSPKGLRNRPKPIAVAQSVAFIPENGVDLGLFRPQLHKLVSF